MIPRYFHEIHNFESGADFVEVSVKYFSFWIDEAVHMILNNHRLRPLLKQHLVHLLLLICFYFVYLSRIKLMRKRLSRLSLLLFKQRRIFSNLCCINGFKFVEVKNVSFLRHLLPIIILRMRIFLVSLPFTFFRLFFTTNSLLVGSAKRPLFSVIFIEGYFE